MERPAFRRPYTTTTHPQPTMVEVDVVPLQPHDLTASQATVDSHTIHRPERLLSHGQQPLQLLRCQVPHVMGMSLRQRAYEEVKTVVGDALAGGP